MPVIFTRRNWFKSFPSGSRRFWTSPELNSTQFRIGVNGVSGQTIALQVSTDLQTWLPVTTNTLAGSRWTYTNSLPANMQFYRAVLSP